MGWLKWSWPVTNHGRRPNVCVPCLPNTGNYKQHKLLSRTALQSHIEEFYKCYLDLILRLLCLQTSLIVSVELGQSNSTYTCLIMIPAYMISHDFEFNALTIPFWCSQWQWMLTAGWLPCTSSYINNLLLLIPRANLVLYMRLLMAFLDKIDLCRPHTKGKNVCLWMWLYFC
jgi:hypothetical protein